MKRLLDLVGLVLVIAGMGFLAYAGVSYAQIHMAATPHWSAAERRHGHDIALSLAIPKSLAVHRASRHHRATRHVALAPTIAPGSEPPVGIIIPAIHVDSPVEQTPPSAGVWPVPAWAVGHLTTTPNPGGIGNMALAAHDDIEGEIFKNIGEMKPGDQVLVRTAHFTYEYVVTGLQTVSPTDTAVLAQTGRPTLTLVSCTPYWVDTSRVIVQAVLKARRPA